MSLIHDALRKARREAAGDADAGRGLLAPPDATRPPRSRLGTGLVLGAAIALAAAVLGAGGVWWLLGGREAEIDTSRPPAAVDARDPARADQSPAAAEPPARAAVAAEPKSDPGSAAQQEARGFEGRPLGTRDAVEPTAPAAPEAAAPPNAGRRPTAAPAPAADQRSSDRVFVVEADLGYARLSLDYIVFRSDDPYAEINGLEVHVGGRVDGFVVEEIGRDRVVLRDDRGRLTLRAR